MFLYAISEKISNISTSSSGPISTQPFGADLAHADVNQCSLIVVFCQNQIIYYRHIHGFFKVFIDFLMRNLISNVI